MVKRTIRDKLIESLLGTWYVLRRPLWAGLALVIAFFMSLIIYFSINIGFYGAILTSSQMAFVDKFHALIVMITSMGKSYGEDANGMLLLVVSLLQGIAIAVFIYTAKRNKKMDAAVVGRSGFALVFAVLGLGCVPCGTSLLIPVMTLLFSSSAPALLGTANVVILVIALGLTIFSLYKIGQVANKYRVSEE